MGVNMRRKVPLALVMVSLILSMIAIGLAVDY